MGGGEGEVGLEEIAQLLHCTSACFFVARGRTSMRCRKNPKSQQAYRLTANLDDLASPTIQVPHSEVPLLDARYPISLTPPPQWTRVLERQRAFS